MKNGPYPYYDTFEAKTVKEIVMHGVTEGGDQVATRFRRNGELCETTFNDSYTNITRGGTYLYSLGLRGGCKIALIGENSTIWSQSFFATILGRNIVVPLDKELPAEDIAYILRDSGCSAIIYSEKYRPVVETLRAMPDMPMEHYIHWDTYSKEGNEIGRRLIEEEGDREFIDQVCEPDDLIAIAYTSGTTGKNKGVMLTNKNVCAVQVAAGKCMHAGRAISFLPMNHTFSWASAIFSLFLHVGSGYLCESVDDIAKDLLEQKPQHFSAVPLVVERIQELIIKGAKERGAYERMLKGIKISNFLMKFGIDKRRKLFKDIHSRLGGNLDMIICGGANLDIELQKFMYSIGILVVNGYGLTECSPAVTMNRIHDYRFGSVGKPIPCCEVKIHDPDEDGVGEIYVKGENVMQGYYNDPETTAETFDGEWLKTGDYGRMDKDNFLYLVGRKKNLIIRGNGKNVSPEDLEARLSRIPYVLEVLVYEENRRIAAELFLNEVDYPDARKRIHNDIQDFNENIAKYMRIGIVKLRDTEFPKTTTLKIVRNYDNK